MPLRSPTRRIRWAPFIPIRCNDWSSHGSGLPPGPLFFVTHGDTIHAAAQIPSLSTRDFRTFYDALTAPVDRKDVLGAFDKYIPIVGLAVRRNYPDVTDEQLGEWLDLHTFRLAIQAVQDASGMTAVSAGE
jgi:hypothetical protein